ncbi:50S ribosomal protein L11 [Candidatus Karelsulcia muelleri]|uniref:Large ribosomal subunit protein uL11 n=1 Tax=Candidatus Karelsulcia muelleri TaxID=336810 RepID=A0A346E159_9FLAO|nr:50S ribosomal protein L11 [Candidatus Karelsulcia muelleri]AXN02714.1 LSU ribosomal protein L11p (L12e) [Candidatus Karelsulcia muelleri]WDI79504.1 50S ribosomal protein L11 [Candidatus Karelsulcia muelleri]WDR78962.1 50S ribosomal protein L11 [Candidatus Karelsulcia muelleri]
MTSKKVIKIIKLNLKGGLANPSPPIGPILGTAGINILEFCKLYNQKTCNQMGKLIPVVIKVNEDRSFKLKIKTPTTSSLLLDVLNLEKGSNASKTKKIGVISMKRLKELAIKKIKDMNCFKIDSAIKMIIGTAKTLGIERK